jgi:hypothetical protein
MQKNDPKESYNFTLILPEGRKKNKSICTHPFAQARYSDEMIIAQLEQRLFFPAG